MTFEEAKKILEKEGFYLIKFGGPSDIIDDPFSEYESPEVYEAMDVVNSAGYGVGMHSEVSNERKARLKKEYKENTKAPGPGVNPALAESASQFNDALLDAQAKKIKRLGKEITRLNKIIHKKNEELRLTKIREKNLAELGLKYVGENEKLKKKLADKIVDEIDARALKSAESALAYKEKVIAEKDEVIADLGNELAATKKELEEKTKLVEEVRKYSKEYREYGIEAVKMIRKMAKAIVGEKTICSEDFKEYRRLANGYMFNPQLPEFSEEEEKKLMAKMVDINAKCMRAARESINDVFESYAAKYAKSTLDELKDKAYESFNAKAHKLGLVGSKDGKGIPDQMIRVDIAEELSKVLDDVIDQFLLFGEIIIKEEK